MAKQSDDNWTLIIFSLPMANKIRLISALIPTRDAASRTRATVLRHLNAAVNCNLPLEVIVVDDGSREPELTTLSTLDGDGVHIIENGTSIGRGGSINRGAREATGDYLLILDCDCIPYAPDFLQQHINAVEAGADVSVGSVLGRGDDFWSRYQDAAAKRREEQFSSGVLYAFTSQNILIATRCYRRSGGFDEGYDHYGFEDRDLFMRVAQIGARIRYTPNAAVIHDDPNVCMTSVSRKMIESGRFTAHRFKSSYPEAYTVLGYRRIDASEQQILSTITKLAGMCLPVLTHIMDFLIIHKLLPFRFGALLVRGMTGLSFMYGTATRSSRLNYVDDNVSDVYR